MEQAAVIAELFHIDPITVLEETSQTRRLARIAAATILIDARTSAAEARRANGG